MMTFLIASSPQGQFASLRSYLESKDGLRVILCEKTAEALALVEKEKVDVVVLGERLADQEGVVFCTELVKRFPLLNCALASSLGPEAFHHSTEGLGVFCQLPLNPSAEDGEKMLAILKTISALLETRESIDDC